jgi:hypothetical protein
MLANQALKSCLFIKRFYPIPAGGGAVTKRSENRLFAPEFLAGFSLYHRIIKKAH